MLLISNMKTDGERATSKMGFTYFYAGIKCLREYHHCRFFIHSFIPDILFIFCPFKKFFYILTINKINKQLCQLKQAMIIVKKEGKKGIFGLNDLRREERITLIIYLSAMVKEKMDLWEVANGTTFPILPSHYSHNPHTFTLISE